MCSQSCSPKNTKAPPIEINCNLQLPPSSTMALTECSEKSLPVWYTGMTWSLIFVSRWFASHGDLFLLFLLLIKLWLFSSRSILVEKNNSYSFLFLGVRKGKKFFFLHVREYIQNILKSYYCYICGWLFNVFKILFFYADQMDLAEHYIYKICVSHVCFWPWGQHRNKYNICFFLKKQCIAFYLRWIYYFMDNYLGIFIII